MPNNEDSEPHVCIICGRRADFTNDDGDFCNECHSILYFKCEHCNEWYRITQRHLMNNGEMVICGQCYEEIGHECSRCGNTYTDDRLHLFRGQMCCDSCIREACRRRNGLSSYHSHSYYVPDDDELRLGFELETGDTSEESMTSCIDELYPDRHNDNEEEEEENDNTLFYLEHDGSIPDYGFELISTPHTPKEYKDDFQKWTNILTMLKKWGLHSPEECGLHIHASKRFMDSMGWNLVGWFVNSNYDRFEKLARRCGNSYSEYYTYGDYDAFVNSIEDMSRYSAVNYHSSQYTVEFRMFASTTNVNTLYEDLELIEALVRWVKYVKESDKADLIIESPRGFFEDFKTYVKNNNYDRANALIERKGV